MKQKISLLVVLVLVLGGVLLFSQYSSPVASGVPGTPRGSNPVTYHNTAFGFDLDVPSATWSLPDNASGDPHLYENAACAESERPNCLALEIQNQNNFTDFNSTTTDGTGSVRLDSLVPMAQVIRSNAPDAAEGWSYEYDLFFPAAHRGFTIFTNNLALEKDVLPTFRLTTPVSLDWKAQPAVEKIPLGFSYPAELIAGSVEGRFPDGAGYVFNFPVDMYGALKSSVTPRELSLSVSSGKNLECINAEDGSKPSMGGTPSVPETVTIKGMPWKRTESGDCGAGTCYHSSQLSTLSGGFCYRVALVYSVGNPANYYEPTSPKYQAIVDANDSVTLKLEDLLKQVTETVTLGK